jgi:chaperone modulatory protein CbpM
MITYEHLRVELSELDAADVERWIRAELLHAEGEPGAWRFEEIDVARLRLILELRDELEVEEHTLPVVLSLVDQLYDMRRRMLRLNDALGEVPAELRARLLDRLLP